MAATSVDGNTPRSDIVTNQNEVKEITRNYLKRSIIPSDDSQLVKAYRLCDKLHRDIFDTVLGFIKAAGEDPKLAENLSVSGADLAGTIYTHTSPDHQRYIALYTACMGYAENLGSGHIEPLAQFSRRFTTSEKQLSPPLEFLANLLRQSYALWPEVGADAIISSTLIAITAMHVECTMGNMVITPKATRWPYYFREKTGFASAYTHFNFTKGWRSTSDSYMQLSPYMEFFINGCKWVFNGTPLEKAILINSLPPPECSDVLSFYKEELSGETVNYVHIRATTDEMTPVDTLRLLADETLACQQKIRLLIDKDRELMAIWRSLEQGFLAFHMKTPRYRLADFALSQDN